jgi:hypothetical protein
VKVLAPDYEAALAEQSLRLGVLVEIDHPAGIVRVWSGVGSLIWNGNTFKGIGALGKIEGIGETAEVRTSETRYSIASPKLDASALTIAMQSPRGRLARTWLALLDLNWQVIDSPILIDESIIENLESQIDETGEQVLSLNATSAIFDFTRPPAFAVTHEQQQVDFPGDSGFDRIPTEVTDADKVWTRT